jgi:hypothetical protein
VRLKLRRREGCPNPENITLNQDAVLAADLRARIEGRSQRI